MHWYDVLSVIAAIITFVGFILTLYQVWGIKNKVDTAVSATKSHMTTLDYLQVVNKAEVQISHILTALVAEEWILASYLVSQLYSNLLELSSAVGKKDELEFVKSKLPSVIYALKEYASDTKPVMSKEAIHNDIINVQEYIKRYELILKK